MRNHEGGLYKTVLLLNKFRDKITSGTSQHCTMANNDSQSYETIKTKSWMCEKCWQTEDSESGYQNKQFKDKKNMFAMF